MSILGWFRRAPDRRECRRCKTALPDGARFCLLCGCAVAVDGRESEHELLRERLTRLLEGRYRVGDVLGAGGMGIVFFAEDIAQSRPVAIKVLPPELARDEAIVARFRREAKTASRLEHPHIVPTYDVESGDGLHYFVMQYVAGRSLEQLLRTEAPVSIPFAIRVLREAAAALAYAHKQGVVHRDVKPDNIMLDENGRVLLADFGISKIAAVSSGSTTIARLTESGGVIGTPHYMSPEHALGQTVDGRADQYALAVVGFQMLAGDVPFDDETAHAIVHLHLNVAPPRLTTIRPDVPPHVAAAIARALSKAAANRYRTIEDFAAALEDEATVDAVTQRLSSPPRVVPSHGVPWAAVLMLLLVGLGGTAAWVGRAAQRASKTAVATAKVGERRTVKLTVASSPRAAVFIDGRRVGETPVSEHPLRVGRSYQLRVERRGYRTKRETITVAASRDVRRSYVLEREKR